LEDFVVTKLDLMKTFVLGSAGVGKGDPKII
jgi:hypothetical protein